MNNLNYNYIIVFFISLFFINGSTFSKEDDVERVSLARSRDGNVPILIFGSSDKKQVDAYSVNTRNETCNSSFCWFLSRMLPQYFSSQLATVIKHSDIEESIKEEEVSIIKTWEVERHYAQQAIMKLESDVNVDYGYQANSFYLKSWYGLKKMSEEEKEKQKLSLYYTLFGNYCNYGRFIGYTNPTIYTINILEVFCEINNLSKKFDSLVEQKSSQETVNDVLYKAAKDSEYNPCSTD